MLTDPRGSKRFVSHNIFLSPCRTSQGEGGGVQKNVSSSSSSVSANLPRVIPLSLSLLLLFARSPPLSDEAFLLHYLRKRKKAQKYPKIKKPRRTRISSPSSPPPKKNRKQKHKKKTATELQVRQTHHTKPRKANKTDKETRKKSPSKQYPNPSKAQPQLCSPIFRIKVIPRALKEEAGLLFVCARSSPFPPHSQPPCHPTS